MPSNYYTPSEKLSKYVLTYFMMENEAIPQCGYPLTIYPNGHVILGIVYGKTLPVITDEGKTFTVPNPGVSGQYMHPVSIRFFDNHVLITIFKPFGFYYIFGIPPKVFLNQTIGLRSLGISSHEEIVERISKARSAPDKINILENWLQKILYKNEVAPVGLPEYFLNNMILSQGTLPLKNILAALRLNSRYVERYFNRYMGVSAKKYSKIIRFNLIANYLINSPKTGIAKLCEIGNFYDPSHLIKEFIKYTGFTPADFLDKIFNEGDKQVETLKRLNIGENII